MSTSKKPVTTGQLFQTKREVVQAVDGILAGFMAKQKNFETRVAKVEDDVLTNRAKALEYLGIATDRIVQVEADVLTDRSMTELDVETITSSLVSAAGRIDALECRSSTLETDLKALGYALKVASDWVNDHSAWAALPWWRRWFTRRPR